MALLSAFPLGQQLHENHSGDRHTLAIGDSKNTVGTADIDVARRRLSLHTLPAGVGAFALAGVTYGTIGKISGTRRTQAECDGTAAFIDRATRALCAAGEDKSQPISTAPT